MLDGEKITLRMVEPNDLDLLYEWENDTSIWHLSNTTTPFSKNTLYKYIESIHDVYTDKQLRLIICVKTNKKPIGAIDLFEFDPKNQRAGVGVLIANKEDKGQGMASEALLLLIEYAFSTLNLHQLYCNVEVNNKASLGLFNKHGFEIAGTKKKWLFKDGEWKDEYFMQLIRN